MRGVDFNAAELLMMRIVSLGRVIEAGLKESRSFGVG